MQPEPGVIALIVLVLLIVGTIAVLVRQRPDSWNLPLLRTTSGGPSLGDDLLSRDASLGVRADAAAAEPALARGGPALSVVTHDEPPPPEPILLDLTPLNPEPSPVELLNERLDHVESHLASLQQELRDQRDVLLRIAMELKLSGEAETSRRDVAIERLRGDVLAMIGHLGEERKHVGRDRRAEIISELYARLARLETALGAVTNPVLLPGEAYAPPAEFLTESLIWENWDEVGERAFALADAYSAQRVYLSEATRAELGAFVTALRVTLTRSIYPQLHADADDEQQAALRSALEQVAIELPRVRQALDAEYRAATEG
ncbi:MAG: hypothetical protein QM692_02655 [Thermomicrobiales bacterium]